MTRWFFILLLAGASCAQTKGLPEPMGDGRRVSVYADTLIASTSGADVFACSDYSGCPASGTCTDHATLGEPDGTTFDLAPSGDIVIAFLCSTIADVPSADGNPTTDFQIWATVPDGSEAVVSLSSDGSHFEVVGQLTMSDQGFDIARTELSYARFVKITHDSGDAIAIDAIEALPTSE